MKVLGILAGLCVVIATIAFHRNPDNYFTITQNPGRQLATLLATHLEGGIDAIKL